MISTVEKTYIDGNFENYKVTYSNSTISFRKGITTALQVKVLPVNKIGLLASTPKQLKTSTYILKKFTSTLY